MADIRERICSDLTIPIELLDSALRNAHTRYRKISIPKRSHPGEYRTAIQPTTELKLVQAWLLENIFSQLPVSKIATAFEPGKSIVENANAHKNSLYSVRVDLSNFFQSIFAKDLQEKLTNNKPNPPSWILEKDTLNLIKQACFDSYKRLPIGYPSSPKIANIVMFDFDEEIAQIVSSDTNRFGPEATVTRYADDFVFSTNRKGASREFIKEISDLIARTNSPKLKINERKTRLMSRARGSTLITGLRVKEHGVIGIHPNYRDHVRLLMKLYARGDLNPEEIPSLIGHLAFIENADPQFFTRLSFRYYDKIAILRKTSTKSK